MGKTMLIVSGLAIGFYAFGKWQLQRIFKQFKVAPVGVSILTANSFVVNLLVTNQNNFDLPINHIEGLLKYNNNVMAAFSQPLSKYVPANGRANVSISINLNYSGMGNALLAYLQNLASGVQTGVQLMANVFTSLFAHPIPINTIIKIAK